MDAGSGRSNEPGIAVCKRASNGMVTRFLATTSLVTAGIAALAGAVSAQGRPVLTLGGSNEQSFGVGSNSASFENATGARVGFDQHSDTEIHFNGAVTLDNGIKIKVRVELEGESIQGNTAGASPNAINGALAAGNEDFLDETWMRISGSFGEVRLGTTDPASMAMTTGYLGTWATNVGINQAFRTDDWVTNPGFANGFGDDTVARVDVSSDAEQISYYTPRYAGFQLGISYLPSRQENVNNQRALTSASASEGWSFGANFDRTFGDLGVGIAGGYAKINTNFAHQNDRIYWGIAARVDYAGFRIAASQVTREDPGTTIVPTGFGQTAHEAGVRYTFGANAVSLSYFHGKTKSLSARFDDDVVVSLFAAYRRTLGPGVFWRVTGIFADYDDGLAGGGPAASNSGHALTTSLFVRF